MNHLIVPILALCVGVGVVLADTRHDFETSHDKLEGFENGPMDVQVFGNHAVVHASVTEKRIRDGKDVSGQFVWMDFLENRGVKCVVVRSAGTRVSEPAAA